MIDPAASWCMLITSAVSGGALARLPDRAVDEILDQGYPFMAGSLRPGGSARRVDGGYRVSGRWAWGSGVGHADWVSVPVFCDEPALIQAVVPRDQIILHDTWHVLGMKGTGSGDYELDDVFVPAHFATDPAAGPQQRGGALYRLGLPGFVVNEHGAFAYAIGRLALATFVEAVVEKKRGYVGGVTVADREIVQRTVSLSTQRMNACQLLMADTIDRLFDSAAEGPPPPAAQADARAAATWCTDEAIEVVSSLFRYAGGSAVMLDHALQRYLRDLFTVQSTWSSATRPTRSRDSCCSDSATTPRSADRELRRRVCPAARTRPRIGPTMITAMPRIAIAMRDYAAAVQTFRDGFGMPVLDMSDTTVPALGAHVGMCVPPGGSNIELMSPANPGAPLAASLQKFLDRRGDGLYALMLEAPDPDAEADALAEREIDVLPLMEGAGGRDLHPHSTHGVLIRVYPNDSVADTGPHEEREPYLSGIAKVIVATVDARKAAAVYGHGLGLDVGTVADDHDRGVSVATVTPPKGGTIELVSSIDATRPFAPGRPRPRQPLRVRDAGTRAGDPRRGRSRNDARRSRHHHHRYGAHRQGRARCRNLGLRNPHRRRRQ